VISLPAPPPPRDDGDEEFWTATTEGRLLLRRCDACGTVIWYPRPICPSCHSTDTSWTDASGMGTVYSFTVVRRGVGRFATAVPYVFAYVELAEGPRVMTNVVDCDPETVYIGMPVELVFHDTGERSALYRFRPTSVGQQLP
jgi:uncharacterized OB-fold protein